MISVIVCTYNREKYLPSCLNHLADQSAKKDDYEIIIIDNKSTDSTSKIAEQFVHAHPNVRVQYVCEVNQGLTYARNRGIQEAQGEILTFIDDDAFAANNFIEELKKFFDNNKTCTAIGGKISPRYEGKAPDWMSKYLLTLVSALDMGSTQKKFSGNKFPIGANMSFRVEVFKKYGLFNPELGRRGDQLEGGEEKELFLRLKKGNENIQYAPAVQVDHIIPESRLTTDYIRGLGIGVGSSEKKRVAKSGLIEILNKLASETIKLLGTSVLFLLYFLRGEFSKAKMLIRFRYWVIKGLLK